MKTTLARKLRELRIERSMTMQQVATELKVSRTTYRDWEYGRKMPAVMLVRVADAFQVSLNVLVGVDDGLKEQTWSQAIRFIEEGLKILKRSQ